MTLSNRKKIYADIHILAKDANLCEDAYRNILFALTGQRSCTQMRPAELETVRNFLYSAATPKEPEYVSDEEALAILG